MNKRIVSIILVLAITVSVFSATTVTVSASTTGRWTDYAATNFESGTGSATNPYVIKTAEQFAAMAKFINEEIDEEYNSSNEYYVEPSIHYSNSYYVLGNDIDLGAHSWVPIGTMYDSGGLFMSVFGFNGCFDGKGYTISNMKIIEDYGYTFYGLFGQICGEVKNFVLKDAVINFESKKDGWVSNEGIGSGAYVGGIAGYCIDLSDSTYGKLSNCLVEDINIDVTAKVTLACGGAVGVLNCMDLESVGVSGNIKAESSGGAIWVGGVIGDIGNELTIDFCFFRGKIQSENNGNVYLDGLDDGFYFSHYVGGFCGEAGNVNYDIIIRNCYSIADIVCASLKHVYAGLFSGYHRSGRETGVYENLYCKGSVVVNENDVISNVDEFWNGGFSGAKDGEIYKNCVVVSDSDAKVVNVLANGSVEKKAYSFVDTSYIQLFKDILGFSEEIWGITDIELPELKICFIHNNVVTRPTINETCTKEGVSAEETCLICGKITTTQVKVNAIGHSLSEWLVDNESTCAENGSKHKECLVCGDIIETETIDLKPHRKSDWIIDVIGTCTTDGSWHIECTVCGEILETQVLKAEGAHDVSEWIIDEHVSCTTNGLMHQECLLCGEIIETEEVVAEGHWLSGWIIDEYATCTTDGSKHTECLKCCETIEIATIPATGHSVVIDSAIPATCLIPGKTSGSHCSVCGEIIVAQTIIPAKGHTLGDWVIDKPATCTTSGSKHKECTLCGEIFETCVIHATGHTSSDWIVDETATCATAGSKHKECTDCGDTLVTETILATGNHTSSDWIVDETATCTADGSKHKECTVCGGTLATETIPAIGHTSSDWIIDSNATVSAPGSKHIECTTCGETLETEVIPQLKPATPKVATANGLNGVNVTWNAVEGAVKYNVYHRQGGSNSWIYVGTTTGTNLTDTKVTSGIYYVYSVRAYNSAGQYSDFVNANTNTRKYMAVPKLTGISNATNGLYIKWNAVPGVTNGYRIYRRGAGSTYWTYLGTVKTTYYTDSQVKNRSGEYFRYTVIADGGYYSTFDTTGIYLKRLANPTLTSAVSSTAGITVKWGAVKGTTGYYVYRKTANSGWVRIAAVGGNTNTTYLDKTAQKGVTYTYTVRAVSGATMSYFNSGISCYDKY